VSNCIFAKIRSWKISFPYSLFSLLQYDRYCHCSITQSITSTLPTNYAKIKQSRRSCVMVNVMFPNNWPDQIRSSRHKTLKRLLLPRWMSFWWQRNLNFLSQRWVSFIAILSVHSVQIFIILYSIQTFFIRLWLNWQFP